MLAVPKLRDDRSNWSDYEPRLQNAMGAKGLWRHMLGTATAPVLYILNNGVPMLADRKTPATEDQIEAKESKIIEFEKWEYLAQHILMSTTSMCLGSKIKALKTAEAMWKAVKEDATSKSTLYILDAEDQLTTIKLADNDDPKTHLSELKQHFQTMLHHHDNLMKIGMTMSDNHFNIIIMSSLPKLYQSTLQMIIMSEQLSRLSGNKSNAMGANNLIMFITEEAQHQVINDECMKTAESALSARLKKSSKGKGKRKDKSKSNETCENCNKPGHTKPECYSKGGGKEGQGLRQKKKVKKTEPVIVAVANNKSDLFAFTCSLDGIALAELLDILKSRMGTCINSRASRDYCPDRSKFQNYKLLQCRIATADGRSLTAVGMDDLHLKLPNRSGKTKTIFKNAIHAPDMAFTLISISQLNRAGFSITFNKAMCTVKPLKAN